MISIIIVLLVVLLCFYLGILYTNPMMIRIGYALGILFVVSIAELIYRLFTLRCSIEVPISLTEQGRPVNVDIKIRNRSILPAGKIEVRIKNKNVFSSSSKKRWITIHDVLPGDSKHTIKMELAGAGCHEIMLVYMKIHSMFGLISIKRRCKDFSSVIIMPEVYSTNIQITEAVRNFLGDADVYDDFRPGYDAGETYGIREYREKDKLQSIHWKLSAKMDELMVKEHSLPKACAIVLMLEFKPWKQKARAKDMDAGAYLELVASISYSLVDQRCPHFVAWYSLEKEGIRRIRIDDEESFYLFLDCYLREVVQIDKNMRVEYRKDYQSEWYVYDLCINEKLELYKNGEFLTRLDEKNIKDECEKLELLF